MGVKERYEAKQRNSKEKTSSSKAKTSSGVKQRYETKKEKSKLVTAINFDTLQSDLSSLSKTLGSVYNGWQTRETMQNTLSSVQSMYDRLGKYQEYQKRYGGADLTDLYSGYKSVIDGWEDLSKQYGKYNSGDEYKKAIEVAKSKAAEYEGMKTADLGAVKTEISDLEEIMNTAKGYQNKLNTLNNNYAIGTKAKAIEDELSKYLKDNGYGSTKDLEKALGEKKSYLNQAQRVQDGIALSSVGDADSENYDKDFDKFVAKGKALGKEKNPWWEGGYKNEVAYLRENPDVLESYENIADDNGKIVKSVLSNQLTYLAAKYMTDEEFGIHSYYLGKDDTEGAEKYLKSIEDTLTQRQGGAIADERESMWSKYTFGGTAGIDQFTQGVINAFNFEDDYIPTTGIQNASALVREDIDYEHGIVGQGAYDLITTTSNMLPSILTSAVISKINPVVGANVGAALMGTSASGSAYQEMLNLGYDKTQSRVYSALVGASEAYLQKLMGGIGALGGTSGKLAKAVKAIDNAAAKFAIQWGGSIASESLEEGLQEVLSPFFKSFAAGYDTGAEVDWGEVFYSAVLGGLSGGFIEGIGLSTNSIGEHYYNKRMGADIKANERVADVFDIASNPEVASAYDTYTRYAKKGINADNISDVQLGRLYGDARAEAQSVLDSKKSTKEQKDAAKGLIEKLDVYAQHNTESRTGSAKNLRKKFLKDFSTEDIVSIIDSGLESAEGTKAHTLATELKSKVENYDKLAEVVAKKMNGEKITEEESQILAKSKSKLSANEIADLIDANESAIREEELSDIATRLVEEGESEELADIVSRQIRGEEITTEEAEKVWESDVASLVVAESVNEDNATAEVMEKAKAMPKEEGALFISLYDGKTDVEAYANAFNLTVAKSKNNFTYGEILNHKNVLSNKQVSKIYGEVRIKADQKQRVEYQKLAERTANLKMYKGDVDDSVIDYENKSTKGKVNWKDLKPEQRKAITFMLGFAKATGLNLTLITDGKKRGINGSYSITGNTIELDIFAESFDFDAKKIVNTIIPTASHELTHWMEKKSPVLFRKISELVFSTLKKADGLTESERIAQEIVKTLSKEYKKRYESEHPGETISLEKARKLIPDDVRREALSDSKRIEVARSEIIARACEDMLSKSKVGREIFNSLSKDEKKTLVEKIKDIVQNIADWVSEALGFYKATSYEASILRMYQEELEKLSAMWDEMLTEAVAVNQALEKSGAYKHNNVADGEVTSIGSHDLSDLSDAVTTDGEQLFQYRAMVEDEEVYRKMLLKHMDTIGINEEQITDLFDMIDSAIDIISENLEALDYAWDADINDRAFHPIKANSDSLYKVSLDFSTLCRKRLLQQTIQNTLQEALNKQLTKEESIAIRDELIKVQEEGRKIEVACALCYVEAARMKSPKQITKFLNNKESIIREFFATRSGGSIKEKVANAEAKARKKLAKDNPDGYYGKNGVELDVLTAPKSKMLKADADFVRAEGKKARASYKLTAHEQAELDAAMKMGISDFTSADGLASLAKNHRDLFDAYTSFVRNATHSKGLEGDVWWRAGDSEAIGDGLIAQMNAENGLRSQSWSDFQVIHLLDYVAATIELSTKGAKRQSYTKVPDYVKLLGNTGDMINMSIIPARAFNGKLEYDDVEGMAYKVAVQLREQYHETAGIICIGMDDTQIRMLLEDTAIDMVIPYHSSSMSKDTRKLMHIPSWKDYQAYQSEKKLSDAEAIARAKEYGVELKKDGNYGKSPKFTDWFNLTEARQIAKMENANPSDAKAYKKYGKMYGGYMAMQNAANNYLKLCAERGIAPKFSHKNADYTHDANYWKLIIDRKMVDNVTGEIIEQKPIKPIFDEKSVLEILNDELARYPQVKADQEYAQRKVVEKFLSGEMKVDKSTLDAIKKPIDNVTKVNILESSENVLNSDRVTEITEEEYKNIKNHFGVTGNFEVAGYMLKDGKMLDFSGKHWGDTTSKSRQVDHRDIQEALPDENNGRDSMVNMISNGNIRLMPEVGGINLSVAPSKNQRTVLRRYIEYFSRTEGIMVDIDEVGGDTVKSFTYDKGVSADRVIRDIDNYFKGGTQSELMRFHTAEEDNILYSERFDEHSIKAALWDAFDHNDKGNDNLIKVSKMPTYFVDLLGIDGDFYIYRDHAYENMVSKEQAESDGRPTRRNGRDINFHNLGIETMTDAMLSIENPSVAIADKMVDGNPVIVMILPVFDEDGAPLYGVVSFYSNRKVNEGFSVKPHILLSIHKREYFGNDSNGRQGLVDIVNRAVEEGRIVDFDRKKMRDDLLVIAQRTRLSNITEKSLNDNLSQFRKEVKEYREKNNILYSDREDTSVYSVMGEEERIKKEDEKFKAEIGRLRERLALERKVTHGNHFNENQLGAVAGHLRNISKSNMDKGKLVDRLKDVYSFIAQSEQLTWEDVFEKCYLVAKDMIAETKPERVVDYYYKDIMSDIRKSKVSFSPLQKQEAAYLFGKNWNRYFFNRVTIADDGISLDSQWQEWASEYPEFFSADTVDTDMPGELYSILNDLRDASETVVEYDTEEQTRWLAREIYNQYWNVSPIRTTADKYDKQIRILNAEHRRTMAEFREDYNSRLKEQHKADKEKYKKLVAEIRERKDKQIALAKEHGREMLSSYKEKAEIKTHIQRITANATTLNKWLTKNSKDYHIHKAMKGPVIKLLNAIDFSSKRMIEKGEPTQKDASFAEAFAEVRAMLQDADNMVEGLESLYGHDLAEDIEKLAKSTYNLIGDNNYIINAMSLEELQSLDKLVRHIKKVVTEINKFHVLHHNQGAVNLANEFMDHGERLGNLEKQHGRLGKFFEFRNRTPYYFFKDLGNVGRKLFEAFQDGWDKLAFNAKTVIDFAAKTYTTKEVRDWSNEIKEFTVTQLDGSERTFKMSIAQIMALHCVSKQSDAQTHLLSGGMTLKRIDKKGHVVADYENISLTLQDIQSILETLTDRQREVADELQRFMNTVCSDWGNEISMARFGIEQFGIPDYFPIKVSEATVPTDTSKDIDNASLFRLLNMSFTKARNKNAEQSIEIGDIFDVFAQHSSDMAKYNALALPVLDFNKFYSIHGKDITGKEYGVVKTLKSVFGDEANGYLRRFVRDLNGSQNVSRDVVGKTFFKNAKVASVAANLRVILLQPTAFFKASAVIDNKYLLKASAYIKIEPIGMVKKLKKAVANAEKYCGIVQWKSLGYYDTDISKGLTEKIKHSETFKDKMIEKSMKGAEIADKATFGTLWVACEFEIRDTRKDLKVGSEEFYQAIGKRLREVIYATQVVDSTMTRSDMMRSSDAWDKMLTTFGSEPTIAYNMLLDLATQFHRDKQEFGTKEARKRNAKKIGKVVTAYVITNAVAALVESGFDALRDDDDEEMDVAEFMKLYLKNFAFDMSIGNKLPFIKEMYSIMQGYSSSRMDTQWLQSLYKAYNTFAKLVSGEGDVHKTIKSVSKAMSDMSGIPLYNVYRDAMAILDKLGLLDD